MGDDDLCRSRLIAAMERQGINVPKFREPNSYVINITNPGNGIRFQKRVAGKPSDLIAFAASLGPVEFLPKGSQLTQNDVVLSPDIYDSSYSRNW